MQADPVIHPLPSRREFTLAAMLAMLSGVSITITACGGGSSSPSTPSGGGSSSGDKTGSVSANHGHVAIITAAQLAAGSAFVLSIMGTADHTHSVTLAATEVTLIAGGTRVAKTSSSTDHSHTVTFN
jgi:hypothetical protein